MQIETSVLPSYSKQSTIYQGYDYNFLLVSNWQRQDKLVLSDGICSLTKC